MGSAKATSATNLPALFWLTARVEPQPTTIQKRHINAAPVCLSIADGWLNVRLGFFRHLHNFFSWHPFREILRMLVLDVDIYNLG